MVVYSIFLSKKTSKVESETLSLARRIVSLNSLLCIVSHLYFVHSSKPLERCLISISRFFISGHKRNGRK